MEPFDPFDSFAPLESFDFFDGLFDGLFDGSAVAEEPADGLDEGLGAARATGAVSTVDSTMVEMTSSERRMEFLGAGTVGNVHAVLEEVPLPPHPANGTGHRPVILEPCRARPGGHPRSPGRIRAPGVAMKGQIW